MILTRLKPVLRTCTPNDSLRPTASSLFPRFLVAFGRAGGLPWAGGLPLGWGSALILIFSGPVASIDDLHAGFRMNCSDLYEQGVVKPVPSHGSGQALSLSQGRSRDFLAGGPD